MPLEETRKIPDQCDPSADPAERAKPAPTAMPYTTALEKIAKWQHASALLAGYGTEVEADNKKLRTLRDSCFDGLIAQGMKGDEVVVLEVEPK